MMCKEPFLPSFLCALYGLIQYITDDSDEDSDEDSRVERMSDSRTMSIVSALLC